MRRPSETRARSPTPSPKLWTFGTHCKSRHPFGDPSVIPLSPAKPKLRDNYLCDAITRWNNTRMAVFCAFPDPITCIMENRVSKMAVFRRYLFPRYNRTIRRRVTSLLRRNCGGNIEPRQSAYGRRHAPPPPERVDERIGRHGGPHGRSTGYPPSRTWSSAVSTSPRSPRPSTRPPTADTSCFTSSSR